MRLGVAIVATLLGACANLQPSSSTKASLDPARAGRQILLTVRQEHAPAVGLTGAPGKRYLHRRPYQATPAVERTLEQLARDHRINRVTGWPIRSLNVYCEVFEVPESETADAVIAELAVDARVDLVQRMNIFETLLSHYDDPYLDLQSAVHYLGVEQAHEYATGRGVTVAVIDSAVDAKHPDLKGRVSIMKDFVNSGGTPKEGEVHGTAVAGVIASVVNNSEGIVGVAPDVNIAALRACWPVTDNGSTAHCSSFSLAQALESALSVEPAVINLSLAGPFDPLLSRLLDAVTDKGIVVVGAAPESSNRRAYFPASHPRVILARSGIGGAAPMSAYLLAAPADEVLTTTPDAGYAFLSGNSLAAAHVSGVVALLMERQPAMGIDQVALLLAETTTVVGGYMSINACRALARLLEAGACSEQVISF